jgi:hypothetical protein
MSRVVERKNCPHCKAKLPEPTPRMCPECAGSLQKRFLSLGCFTTAPPIVLALVGAGLLARGAPSDDAETRETSLPEPIVRSGSPSQDAGGTVVLEIGP